MKCAQAKAFAASNGDIVSLITSGDAWACLTCGIDSVANVKRQGGQCAYVVPNEGAFAWCDALCIPTSAENLDTAHAFINEAIGGKEQAFLAALQDVTSYTVDDEGRLVLQDGSTLTFEVAGEAE